MVTNISVSSGNPKGGVKEVLVPTAVSFTMSRPPGVVPMEIL